MLTRSDLTTAMGYLKFGTRSAARRAAGKLDLAGTHKHDMPDGTIYMPGTTHDALNAELRKRGLPPKRMRGGGGGGRMMPDDGMGAVDVTRPTQNYTADELDELVEPEFDPAVDEQLEGGLIDEDVATGIGLGVGDDDDDDEMEIY